MSTKNKLHSNVINIRMSDKLLAALDEMVTNNQFKSRSDCVKSLIENELNKHTDKRDIRNEILDILQTDDKIKGIINEMIKDFFKTL